MNRRQRRKILSDKGKEWSEESAAIMELFRQWLIISGLKKTEFLNRVDGGFFKIFFHRGDGMAKIFFQDEGGAIGEPFVWWEDSGIAFEDYMTDASFLFYILVLCAGVKRRKRR